VNKDVYTGLQIIVFEVRAWAYARRLRVMDDVRCLLQQSTELSKLTNLSIYSDDSRAASSPP